MSGALMDATDVLLSQVTPCGAARQKSKRSSARIRFIETRCHTTGPLWLLIVPNRDSSSVRRSQTTALTSQLVHLGFVINETINQHSACYLSDGVKCTRPAGLDLLYFLVGRTHCVFLSRCSIDVTKSRWLRAGLQNIFPEMRSLCWHCSASRIWKDVTQYLSCSRTFLSSLNPTDKEKINKSRS